MKSTYFAVVLTLSLLISCDLSAEARPASSHSGTSLGFKGGFSSQKSNFARSAPPPVAAPSPVQRSGPGAFGKAGGADAPPPQPSRSSSALSRDMEQNAAQANALKTLDARRAAAATSAAGAGAAIPPTGSNVPRPPQPGQPPVYNQPGYSQPNYPQPIIVQQPSNGLMHGVIGFMLGRAMSQPQPVYYPQNNGGHGNNGSNTSNNAGDWDNGSTATLSGSTSATAAAMAPVPQAAPARSFLATVLRTFVWLALVSGLVWLAIYTVRKLRRLRAASAAHYSFERN